MPLTNSRRVDTPPTSNRPSIARRWIAASLSAQSGSADLFAGLCALAIWLLNWKRYYGQVDEQRAQSYSIWITGLIIVAALVGRSFRGWYNLLTSAEVKNENLERELAKLTRRPNLILSFPDRVMPGHAVYQDGRVAMALAATVAVTNLGETGSVSRWECHLFAPGHEPIELTASATGDGIVLGGDMTGVVPLSETIAERTVGAIPRGETRVGRFLGLADKKHLELVGVGSAIRIRCWDFHGGQWSTTYDLPGRNVKAITTYPSLSRIEMFAGQPVHFVGAGGQPINALRINCSYAVICRKFRHEPGGAMTIFSEIDLIETILLPVEAGDLSFLARLTIPADSTGSHTVQLRIIDPQGMLIAVFESHRNYVISDISGMDTTDFIKVPLGNPRFLVAGQYRFELGIDDRFLGRALMQVVHKPDMEVQRPPHSPPSGNPPELTE